MQSKKSMEEEEKERETLMCGLRELRKEINCKRSDSGKGQIPKISSMYLSQMEGC